MRLLDAVCSCTAAVTVDLGGQRYRLPGAGSFAADVAASPLRYVLDGDVLEAAEQIVRRWPDLLDPSDPRLRVPAESLWIEWRTPDSIGGQGQQAGMLVETAADGRSGQARSFWMGEYGAEAAQIALHFDFDPETYRSRTRQRDYPVSGEPHVITSRLSATVDQGWHRYFAATALGPTRIGEAVQLCANDGVRDFLLVLAFMRLLNSQLPIRRREIDRSQLNAARLRTGKPALLDHIELSLAIGEGEAGEARRGHGERSPVRLHLVRGHLVRRRDMLFWRSPHLRGGTRREGKPVVKTIHARLR